MSGNFRLSSVGMTVFSLRSDDRVISALGKDVDAVTGLVHDRVGGVARAAAEKILYVPLVFCTHQIEGDYLRLEGVSFGIGGPQLTPFNSPEIGFAADDRR